MGETELVELEAWDWIAKITEKLTFIRLRVNEGVDITDEDYDILKMMFRLQWEGRHQLYLSKPDIKDETAEQQGLFGQNDTNTTDGTEIELLSADNLKEKKNEKKLD